MSGASERANGRASGPVLQYVFLAVIEHSAMYTKTTDTDRVPTSKAFLRYTRALIQTLSLKRVCDALLLKFCKKKNTRAGRAGLAGRASYTVKSRNTGQRVTEIRQ